MDHKKWYRLDNAGKLYPSIASTRRSTVFRLSAKTNNQVDPSLLQEALDLTILRFPYYKVNLKRGLFWYYFEEVAHMPQVQPETHYPCMFLRFTQPKTFPFRVLYHNQYIHLEMSHSIADGNGALTLLKTLLLTYYQMKEDVNCLDFMGAKDINEQPESGEFEDAFIKYYQKGVPTIKRPPRALDFPFELMEKGKYSFLTGICPLEEVIRQAKTHNCSVTQFMSAIYFMAIQDYVLAPEYSDAQMREGRIVLNLPVDLRKIFPSKTMKNFFVSLTPAIDLRNGTYTLDEIIDYLKGYMQQKISKKTLSQYISRNVKNERHPIIRILPLPFKNMVMPFIYVWFGERVYTSSISNLGLVKLPREIEPFVDAIEFFPAPSETNKIKMCMSAYKEELFVSFGRTTENTEIEMHFFRRMVKLGIPVKMETNLNQTDKEGVN